jgi:guanylate kinase
VEGVDYYFVSKAAFMDLIARNELLDHAVVYGGYKGFGKSRYIPHHIINVHNKFHIK